MKVMISAGEASGEIHAANLVKALKEKNRSHDTAAPPECFGMGGTSMAQSGVDILVNVEKTAVMGLLEVLHKYPSLRANLATLRKALTDRKPDILVLVDYPHFNMKLASTAKELGIPVLFFIAPKVWASRPGRVDELRELVNHMALILPFEKQIFDDANIPSTYVGNPLLDNKALLDASSNKAAQDPAVKRIALLPGSRESEIGLLLPPMIKTAEKLNEQYPQMQFVLPVADTIDEKAIQKSIAESSANINLITPGNYTELSSCAAALVASGTATLELAILGVPMVVIYKLNPLSYPVLKRWLTIEHISLVNIIAKERVVPELIQEEVSTENLVKELNTLLTDSEAKNLQLQKFKEIHEQLGSSGASAETAELIIRLIKENGANAQDIAVS